MGAFKLGRMTFGSLFRKPETVMYPIETKPQPKGLKGHIAIEADACILCGMCDRSCPTTCITVDKKAGTWEINRFSCIQCGYCVTVCPKKCLAMEPGYAPAATAKSDDVFEVPTGAKPAKRQAVGGVPGQNAEKPKAETVQVESPGEPDVPVEAADAVLMSKIAMMEPEKAKKVRAALGINAI